MDRPNSDISAYVRMLRLDHWIKQLFILPGVVLAVLLSGPFGKGDVGPLAANIVLSFVATCLVASANYVINEWLDREFDQFHPVKKSRPAVNAELDGRIVWVLWTALSVLGTGLAWLVNPYCCASVALLCVMGITYNVKPLRLKDLAYLDVLSESLNNALRLLIGWFSITATYLPPSSVVLGYWMAGAYLMAIKRFSEYRAIGDAETAGLYRRSFAFYTEQSLLNSSLFYAMFSVFLLGVFLVKYHIEYLLIMPFLCGLYVMYFNLAFEADSATQAPEKLYREKGLMVYVLFLIVLFIALTFIKIPLLEVFEDSILIGVSHVG